MRPTSCCCLLPAVERRHRHRVDVTGRRPAVQHEAQPAARKAVPQLDVLPIHEGERRVERVLAEDGPRQRQVGCVEAREEELLPVAEVAVRELLPVTVDELQEGRHAHVLAIPVGEAEDAGRLPETAMSGDVLGHEVGRGESVPEEEDEIAAGVAQREVAGPSWLEVRLVEDLQVEAAGMCLPPCLQKLPRVIGGAVSSTTITSKSS